MTPAPPARKPPFVWPPPRETICYKFTHWTETNRLLGGKPGRFCHRGMKHIVTTALILAACAAAQPARGTADRRTRADATAERIATRKAQVNGNASSRCSEPGYSGAMSPSARSAWNAASQASNLPSAMASRIPCMICWK